MPDLINLRIFSNVRRTVQIGDRLESGTTMPFARQHNHSRPCMNPQGSFCLACPAGCVLHWAGNCKGGELPRPVGTLVLHPSGSPVQSCNSLGYCIIPCRIPLRV
jgi:hypothetical protein